MAIALRRKRLLGKLEIKHMPLIRDQTGETGGEENNT